MRLYNYLKNNLNLTKSEVIKLDKDNKITVNDEKKNLSYIIRNGDIVKANGIEVKEIEKVYYLYNKPVGVVCTNDLLVKNNIKDITNIK